jgi:methyl-accepting chemotaxis protein
MFTNLKISTRLYLSFITMIFLMFIVGVFAISQMNALSGLTTKLYNHPLAISKAVRDVNIHIVKMRGLMKQLILTQDKMQLDAIRQNIASHEQQVHQLFKIIEERFLGDQQDVKSVFELFAAWQPIREEIFQLKLTEKNDEAQQIIDQGKGSQHFMQLEQALTKLTDFADHKADEFLQHANEREIITYLWVSTVMLITLIIGIWIAWLMSRTLSRALNAAIVIANNIANGDLNNQIEPDKTEMGQLLQALAGMQTQLKQRIQQLNEIQQQLQQRIEEDKRIANEALRLNRALDNVLTNVLIIDHQNKIIYLNQAAKHLFHTIEEKIRTELPYFDADHLQGTNIDVLYKNPVQQRQLLAELTQTRRATLEISGLVLDYTITPVFNEQKERIGSVFEFQDRTIEIATEQEINAVIQAASEGNFELQIRLDNKSGFFHTFSESINQIIKFNQLAIQDIMRMFAALAQGDLSQKIETNYQGAYERLKNDANATVEQLTEIIIEIKKLSDMVNENAQGISQGNVSLSQRTEEQAASLEETAASMEQMTSTVQQNADNSKYASQLAQSARDYAIQGGEVVNAAINAMTDINNSSQKITDIISVINEIAFQTNLLALNAAVEAARAGEQGRGFAVVASEVRNLAQRSATAAKEIKELIQDSVARVEEGTKLANQSGEKLEQIVTAIKKVTDLIAEIASASQEQSSGIHQVNKAVSQMDEMTQQNAALVEELASSSEAMNQQAQKLKQQVAFFQLTDESIVSEKKLPIFQPKKARSNHHSPTSKRIDDEWKDF